MARLTLLQLRKMKSQRRLTRLLFKNEFCPLFSFRRQRSSCGNGTGGGMVKGRVDMVDWFILVLLVPLVWSKGIVLYGKGKVVSGKRGTTPANPDDTDDTVDKFQFALFTPTSKSARPSDNFQKFSRRAVSATLAGHGQHRTYYFMQDRRNYDTSWTNDTNVCTTEVQAWQLHPSSGFLFTDADQSVTIYFLCDQYCCSYQCCDINVIFLVCIIFFVLMGLSIVTWLCCRFGSGHCKRVKSTEEDEYMDAVEYLPPMEVQRTRSVPLTVRAYNQDEDDVKL